MHCAPIFCSILTLFILHFTFIHYRLPPGSSSRTGPHAKEKADAEAKKIYQGDKIPKDLAKCLFEAVMESHVYTAKYLLAAGAPVNYEEEGCTMLGCAFKVYFKTKMKREEDRPLEMISALLSEEADICRAEVKVISGLAWPLDKLGVLLGLIESHLARPQGVHQKANRSNTDGVINKSLDEIVERAAGSKFLEQYELSVVVLTEEAPRQTTAIVWPVTVLPTLQIALRMLMRREDEQYLPR